MIRVKVCGITNIDDALCCVDCGVSALGFNFYKLSPRYIHPENAKLIIRQLPPFIGIAGLFVNENADNVKEVAGICRLDTLQFHGDEAPEFIEGFKSFRVIKALRIKSAVDLSLISQYDANGYLLDSYHPELYGGSGTAFDWRLLAGTVDCRKLIIAGGIKPDNVEVLLENVKPYGIDLCSGVEASAGIKDHNKIRELMRVINKLNFKEL